MNWTSGYVADLGYTAGFYRETAPSHMAFAALIIGRSPGHALHPKRILELGSGQGFGLSLLAAANPHIAFEGYDFNPEHVANTRRLIEGGGLANVTVSETSFEEAAARGGDNDLDVIALHGIFSWVARPIQDAIIAIMRQRLLPNGLAYVSYNCMPGWAPLAPIRQVMVEVKRRNPGRSERQLALALDLITRLREGNAAYFAINPAAGQHFDAMLKLDRVYLAHEYLHEHWDLFQFSDMAARLSEAKLSYLASATIPENFDGYSVPQNLQPLLAQTDDPVLKETIRDFAANKHFRRDLFARGSATLNSGEHRRALSELSFTLAAPRSRVDLTGREDLYLPIVNLLAQKNPSFDELLALPSFGEGKVGILLDCLVLLVHSGQILPIIGSEAVDAEPAQRFNRMIVGHCRTGRIYQYLAAPVAGTGIPVTDFGLLALAGILDGKTELVAVAKHAMSILKVLGQAIALGYAREGAQVAVLDIDGDAAAETVKAITAAGGKAFSFMLDVTERDKCRVVAAQIGEKIGRVSILVNNAGINRRNAFTADPEAVIKDWQDIMAVNLNGVFNVTHAFLGQLRATRGRIVNIGSIQSFVHVRTPNSPAYTTSKHGVLGFTRALAAELGKDGVRVNAIGPGLVETPLNEKARASNPELVKTLIDHTPLGRTGKPEDIVGPAIFLASDLSAYVTGSIIMADGGYRSI